MSTAYSTATTQAKQSSKMTGLQAVNTNYLKRRNPSEVWDSIDTKSKKNKNEDTQKHMALAFGLAHLIIAFVSVYHVASKFMGI